MNKKIKEYLVTVVLSFICGVLALSFTVPSIRAYITKTVGLAVAQSNTVWKNVNDAAKGDSLTEGIMAISPYVYNGISFDRARGDTTYGLDVDVSRVQGTVSVAFSRSSTFTHNQVSVTDTATQIIASDSSRLSLIVRNIGANEVYIGSSSSVTSSNGFFLNPGDAITLDKSYGDVYGICSTGETTTVAYIAE